MSVKDKESMKDRRELGWQDKQKYGWMYCWGDRYRLKRMASFAHGKILDIGWYQRPNYFLKKAIGLDVIDPVELPENYDENYQINIDDPYPYPFGDNTFDTVVAGELIEHISDTDIFLKELHRIIKPGGKLILSTPNPASPVEVLVHLFRWVFRKVDFNLAIKGDHVHGFLYTHMITLLNLCSFKPVRMEGAYIQIPFTNIQIPTRIQPLAYQTIYVAICRK